jgi:peptidoglycan-associated lipoprotein
MTHTTRWLLAVTVAAMAVACGGKKAPTASAPPPPPSAGPSAFPSSGPPAPGRPPESAAVASNDGSVTASPLLPWDNQPIDVINGPDSPLKPVFFLYDSDELDDAAKGVLKANADVLKTYRTWVITIEGHCDERGTAEYNLALGDRRALAAKNYLASLGIAADRVRTVSYGNEFPFDAGHNETAWAKNRRAHFMLTSK